MSDLLQTVVLSGIGGYGQFYLNYLQLVQAAGQVRLIGAIDPFAERAGGYASLVASGVPVWPDFAAFRAASVKPDLVILASPIQFHCEQTCAALESGLNVLCEKPVAATTAEADRMAAARTAAGRLLAVGYQWSFSPAIQTLKADLLDGRYGVPRRFRTWVSWPRSASYYGRNRWAGRIRDDTGRLVHDSPVNNATAHYLHNMLYLLGPTPDSAAAPLRVTAELYRANPIENFDAACLRVTTARGVESLFFTAHCVDQNRNPAFILECDRGTLRYDVGENGSIIGHTCDGATRDYGNPYANKENKLVVSLEAARHGRCDTPCGIEAAAMHTRVVDALQRLPIHTFPAAAIAHTETQPGDFLTFVPGLTAAMERGFTEGRLLSEIGFPWAQPAATADCALPSCHPCVRLSS